MLAIHADQDRQYIGNGNEIIVFPLENQNAQFTNSFTRRMLTAELAWLKSGSSLSFVPQH